MPPTLRAGAVAVVTLLAGAANLTAPVAAGTCAPSRGGALEAAVAFVGVAEPGSADPDGGRLLSPARFRVERWRRGAGGAATDGEIVTVETGVTNVDGLLQYSTDQISPRAGERWEIAGDLGSDGRVVPSVCAGSERLSIEDVIPVEAPPVTLPASRASGPGDGRLLSLAVAAAGAVAIAVVLSRRGA